MVDASIMPREVVKTIIPQEGYHHMMMLKGNQEELFDDVKLYFTDTDIQVEESDLFTRPSAHVPVGNILMYQF